MGSPGAARSTALQATVRAAEADHARLGHDRTQDRLAQIITYLPRPSTPGGDGRLRQTPSCPRTRCQALALPPALAPRRAPGRLQPGRWPSAACPCPPPPPFLSPARNSRSPEARPKTLLINLLAATCAAACLNHDAWTEERPHESHGARPARNSRARRGGRVSCMSSFAATAGVRALATWNVAGSAGACPTDTPLAAGEPPRAGRSAMVLTARPVRVP